MFLISTFPVVTGGGCVVGDGGSVVGGGGCVVGGGGVVGEGNSAHKVNEGETGRF